MLYFIVTTSLYNDCRIRKSQYIDGISRLKKSVHNLKIQDYKIIIIENNGNRNTFFDTLDCTTFYTANNILLKTKDKGHKELQDILDCIDHFKIDDTDFIVKMTGRYTLDDDSDFMNIKKNIHNTKYDCVIKYGPYFNPVNYKMNDCITGLIGTSCGYIKQIKNEPGCLEWNWAKVTYLIDDEKICKVNKLGINICPGSNRYFKV